MHQQDKPLNKRTADRKPDSDIKALEKMIAEATGLRVSLQPGPGEKGKIIFNYKTLDQFEELCKKLGAQL
jgi:ParB family chromosome partitioning protein